MRTKKKKNRALYDCVIEWIHDSMIMKIHPCPWTRIEMRPNLTDIEIKPTASYWERLQLKKN